MKTLTYYCNIRRINPLVGKIFMGLVLFNALFVQAQTPVAYYPFSGNANDAIGTNHGTVNGATLTTDRFGNANSAYSFNGTANYVEVTDANSIDLNINFTISTWLFPTGPGSEPQEGGIIINKEYSYQIVRFTNGTIQFALSSNGTGNDWNYVNTSIVAPLNTWTHITLVKTGSVVTVYKNGTSEFTDNSQPVSLAANTSNLRIGGRTFTPHFFDGKLDEVKIYNTALTASQILAEYNIINGFELLLPIAVSPGGTNPGSCGNFSDNTNSGGNAIGFGCGGGGANWWGGHGGAGYLGGGGGGAAGFNAGNREGGMGGHGAIALALANSNGTIVSNKLLVGGSSFTIPAGVTQVKVFAIGAGGGGAGATGVDGTSGGGGAAGGVAYKKYSVAPGDVITYTLGIGGSGGIDINNGNAGTNTSATLNGVTIIGNGGQGGTFNNNADAAGGAFSGGDGGATGGNGKGTSGDTGGGAGGGTGGGYNASVTCTGGIGANSQDVDVLFGILGNSLTNIDNLPTLIAHYPLNGSAADISGNNLNGTIIGSLPGTTDRYGIASGAISFNNNTANRIEVDDNLLLRIPSITLSAWVKLNSLGSIRTFVDKPMGTSFTDSWHFGTENSNFSSWHFDAPTLNPYSQVTSPAGTGQWYYVVSTFDNASKQHKLYIDGVLRTTNTFNSTIGYDASKMYIGAAIENGSLAFPMDGAIDEVKIYSGAMTASQISNEYQNEVLANKPGSGDGIGLDGNDDYVQLPSVLNGATQFTVDFWIKTTENRTSGTYWQKPTILGNANPSASDGDFGITTNNGMLAVWHGLCCGDVELQTTRVINDNQWHHVAAVNDGSTLVLFVDGIQLPGSLNTGGGALQNSAFPWRLGMNNSCCSGNFPHQGTLDEFRIWNVALTQAQIRERMCKKIINTDVLYNNLSAYYNFDEKLGSTLFDGSSNYNTATLNGGAARVTSGAPIGNTSAFDYSGASASLNMANPTRGDDLTVALASGGAGGVHIYIVNEAPNTRNGIEGLESNNAYFGTFVVGGSSPSFNAVYNYDGIPDISDENALSLFSRNDNSGVNWTGELAAINTSANTLTKNSISASQKEFIIGANDPGNISASQSSCFAMVPVPLTGTAAFNGAAGVTYQWQDSIAGGSWQNIAGAIMVSPLNLPFASSPKYYRRLATLGSLTLSSNNVFLDIRGAISPGVLPTNQWNLYAYDGTSVDSVGVTFKGSYTRNTLGINTITDFGSGNNPSAAAGYAGCIINAPGNTWSLYAKRKGFPTGSYALNIPQHDDEIKIFKDGVLIISGSCCNNLASQFYTLGTLNANSVLECRVTNSGGGPGHLVVDVFLQNLAGGTIGSNQSNCNAFTPSVLTNNHPAYGGSSSTINYQWQESNNNVTFTDISGATSLTYQPGLITSDKYFRRKATNTNNEVAFSNVVFMDINGQTFYADVDGDGYGDPNNTTIACSLPPGYLTDNTDCNDADPLQRPGQVWYTDMDNDGYVSSNGPGQPALTITQCSRPAGGKLAAELASTVGRDCNDNDPTINPLAQRLTISSDPDFANGVYPLQGDPSTTFFFEAMYFDDNNALPSVTFPRAYLDFESNNLINEPQDRIVVMTEFDASDQNTVDGKKYVGSISGLPNGNTWQTYLISEYSNTCQRGTGPFPHPDVLLQPNVQIFANYIEFSDENPPVSSPLSIMAYVGNPSDFAVQNVVVRMRNQAEPNTVYPDVTIPYIAAHTSGVATWNITTPSFTGICPIQVTVDYTNNIPESNELDNVAVSFFNNGNAPVNGEIIVEAGVYPSTSYATANNTLYLKFNSYFNGTNLPPELKVAGALVTFQIDETGATFTGFTGLGGDISIPFTAPVSPGVYHISGTVSSPPFTGYINPNITNFELIYGNDPDYTVELSASSTTCLAGQSITHTIVVTNDGLAASIVGSHLTLSVPGGNPSLITFDVPPLAIGESYTIDNVNILVPTAGTYTACAQADVLQEVIELNETNNNSCINIIAAIAVPDLEVIQGSSGPHSICNPVDLFAMIRNAGGVSCAAFSSRMVVKLGNTIIQTFDHSVPALGPSEAYSYTKTFIPAVPGTYTYSVEADFSHVVTEYDENNNINSFSIEVTPCLPELAAEYCDLTAISANDYTSGNMTLSATINNTGELDVAAAVLVRFQFSNNTFVDATHLGGIPKGQSVTVTAARPAFVNPGVTMKVIVDPNNTIAELYETNNESWQKPTAWALAFTNSVEGCGPDLNDYNYKPFYAYYLPVKIVNLGLYNADTVKVKYEISGPGLIGTVHLATVNAFDIFTDCDYCPQGVSLPSPFVFPQAGIYTLTLTIDPGNVYNEVDEGNNVWVIPIEVNNKPDMRVLSDYINPTLLNPAKGQPVTISVTYDNVGFSNVADQMKMKLFVDNVAIDSVSGLSGLASGNYTTVNFTVPWSSTVPGTHVIKAFIDSDNGILENDETNNIATRAITVGTSANLWVKSLSVLNYYPDLNDNITIKTKIENQGDLPTNALVSVFYVNNSLDSVLIAAHQVSLPGNDSISLNIPWVVADNKTKIVVVISNSTALEYNYTDNSAFIELGKMALFTEAFPACETGNKGTMTAYINGGEPPYTYSWSNGAATKSILAAADTYSVTVFDATGQQVSGSGIIPPCTGILVKAKCYLEGFYIAPGLMSSALTQSGIVSPLEYTDTITVRLHAPTAGFPLVASCKAILHNNGTVTCEFPAGVSGSSRYIVLEHRNSIETWSAAPVLISNGMMYDFSNAANKAYGNNLLLMLGGTYAIYGGDVNQDGSVDTGDSTPVDNDSAAFVSGYVATDANGDGSVDTADMTIIDNNGAAFVTAVTP